MHLSVRHCLAGAAMLLLAGAASAQPTDPAATAADRVEYDRLFQEMLADPADLDTMFAFAAVASRLGENDQAISTLERMLMFNPDLPRVRLELGALYFRVGAYEVARSYLTQAASGPDVPPAVRERVFAYLAEIDRRTARQQLSGSIFAGLQYQDNPTAAPGLRRTELNGIVADLDDTFREHDDVNAFLFGNVTHRWDFDNRYGEAWESRGSAYVSRQFEETDVDLTIAEIRTGPELALLPAHLGDTTIYPFALAELVILDSARLYSTLGGGAELRHRANDRLELGLDYTLRYREYRKRAGSPITSDQSGFENRVGVLAGYRIAPALTAFGEAYFTREEAEQDFFESDEFGIVGAVRYEYLPPGDWSRIPWQVTLASAYVWQDYDAADPTLDPSKRRDREWRISLANSFRIDPAWSVEAQVSYTDSDSNIPIYEYENFSFLIGALFRF